MLRKLIAASFVAVLSASPIAFAQTASSVPPAQAPHQTESQGNEQHQRFCTERYARTAGRLAYLEAKLELTAEQRPLWEKWRDAAISGAEQQRALCRQSPFGSDTRPTIVQRYAHFGQMTAARAQSLQTAQPALEALYQALSPEQRGVLDRPAREHGHGHGHRHDGDRRHGEQRESD
jgi:hypothetical protein